MALTEQDVNTQMEAAANAPDPKTDAPHPMVGATPAPPNPIDAAKAPPPAVPTPSFLDSVISNVDKYTSKLTENLKAHADNQNDAMNTDPAERAIRAGASGAATAVANTAQAAEPYVKAIAGDLGFDIPHPAYEHARQAVLNFRDAIALKDPSIPENLIKGAGQFIPSFMMFSRVLGSFGNAAALASGGEAAAGLAARAAATTGKVAQFAAADAATSATVNAPHDPRLSDAVSLMMHSEGQFGNLLREVAPDGVQHYINYLADHENEGEAEGRWKNVVDGWGAGAALTGMLHTGGSVLKQGWNALHFMADNNMGSMGDLTPPTPGSQRGAVGDLTKPQDTGAALQDAVLGKEPPFGKPNQGPSAETIPDAGLELAPSPKRAVSSGSFPSVMASDEDLRNGIVQNRNTVNTLRNVLQKFNDRGGAQVPGGPLEQQAYGHGAPLKPILQTLSSGISRNTPQGAFYGDIIDRLVAKDSGANVVASGTGYHTAGAQRGDFGTYHTDSHTLAIHQGALDASNQSVLHTFVHEAVHSATIRAFADDKDAGAAVKGLLKEATAAAKPAADEGTVNALAALKDHDRYGLTNVNEFAAEAEANPRFRTALKMTQAADGSGSLWDKYKAVVGHILGVGSVAVGSKAFDKLLTKQESEGA